MSSFACSLIVAALAAVQIVHGSADLEYSASVSHLTPASFGDCAETPHVVEFYAPWCPHCQHFAPIYSAAADRYATANLVFGSVNCVNFGALCNANAVRGYPTIKLFHAGLCAAAGALFSGSRSHAVFNAWLVEHATSNFRTVVH